MESSFLDHHDPRWVTALNGLPHDVYHLPAYVSFEAREAHGEPVAFLASEGGRRFLLPLIVRPIDPSLMHGDERFDATSPYGYPGPLLDPTSQHDHAFLARAIAALRDGLCERGVVSAFVRLHPLLPVPLGPLSEVGEVVQHGETVTIDLTLPSEEHWRQTRHNHRRDINKAKRNGHHVRLDETFSELTTFVALYHETMRRVAAADSYYFSATYFRDLQAALGGRLHLSLVEIDGQIAAAGLFTEEEGIVQYHLSGTATACLPAHPLKFMLHCMRGWAKERGNRFFHLGGGLGGSVDPLFAFKVGFSDGRSQFATWRLVTDPPAYHRLVTAWQTHHGGLVDDPTGFFPAYRKSGNI